ncbi:hypothetical protein [Streptomyces bullii]|uniref:Uncharacterized protein n=1 Tax=Streptomyces bullii TaxID=349910 RepID=A0ABW0V1A2_9ACTN
MGFDTHDPGQLRLRALLALGIFNGGRLQQWPGTWAMASVTHYDLVLSPRADNLVLITPTPSNVLQYLVPRGRPMGLPGLRLEETTADSFLLRHVVIGARMTVTDRPPISPFGGDFDGDRVWNVQQELTAAEQEALADVPPMTDDASVLLSGLMSRIGLREPGRNWALVHGPVGSYERVGRWPRSASLGAWGLVGTDMGQLPFLR